jgi:sodium pump decarboxylase gamma subunit
VLEFQATGLVVVFGALAVLWLLLEVMGAFFRSRPAKAAAVPAQAAAPAVEDGLTEGVVAAIAAAVHVTMKGQPHQITEIKASKNNPTWAAEGRREHFSSHRVR